MNQLRILKAMERLAPWLSPRAERLFDEAEQFQLRERAMRVIEEHHRVAAISVHIEKLLEEQTCDYTVNAKMMLPGRYFEDISELQTLIHKLPTEELRQGFREAINEYGKRVVSIAMLIRTTWKEPLQGTPLDQHTEKLGKVLFTSILGRAPVGTPLGCMKPAHFEIICENDADYAALYRRHGTEELPGETKSAGCQISEVSIPRPTGNPYKIPLIVLHQKRSGTVMKAIRRHEFQHLIQNVALQTFARTEATTDPKNVPYAQALRPIKDEVLAYTREGRSAQATQSALDGELYKKLFDAVPAGQQTQAKACAKEAIEAINRSVLIRQHGDPGRALLVNLLYRIPLDRIARWIPVIDLYYEKRIAIAEEHWLINRVRLFIRDHEKLPTFILREEYLASLPESYRANYKREEKARAHTKELFAALRIASAHFPDPLPVFDVLSKDGTDMLALPALQLSREEQHRLKDAMVKISESEQKTRELEDSFRRLPFIRIALFGEELEHARRTLPSMDYEQLAARLFAKNHRPQMERYTNLLKRIKRQGEALLSLEQLFQLKASFRDALIRGAPWEGRQVQQELETIIHEIDRLREEMDKTLRDLERDDVFPPSLQFVHPAIRETKKGPHPFEPAHEALLSFATEYQRRAGEVIRRISQDTPRWYSQELRISKGTEAARLQQEVVDVCHKKGQGRIQVKSCTLLTQPRGTTQPEALVCRLILKETRRNLEETVDLYLPYLSNARDQVA